MGFVATIAFFLALYLVPVFVPFPPAAVAVMIGCFLLAVGLLRAWSGRAGWGREQTLAVVSGALGLGIALSPIRLATGLPLVALAFLVLLIRLARRAARPLPEGNAPIVGA